MDMSTGNCSWFTQEIELRSANTSRNPYAFQTSGVHHNSIVHAKAIVQS